MEKFIGRKIVLDGDATYRLADVANGRVKLVPVSRFRLVRRCLTHWFSIEAVEAMFEQEKGSDHPSAEWAPQST